MWFGQTSLIVNRFETGLSASVNGAIYNVQKAQGQLLDRNSSLISQHTINLQYFYVLNTFIFSMRISENPYEHLFLSRFCSFCIVRMRQKLGKTLEMRLTYSSINDRAATSTGLYFTRSYDIKFYYVRVKKKFNQFSARPWWIMLEHKDS